MQNGNIGLRHVWLGETFAEYLFKLEGIADLFAISVLANQIVPSIKESIGEIKIPISDNFGPEATTIRSLSDLETSIEQGRFMRSVRFQCIAMFCSALEDLIANIRENIEFSVDKVKKFKLVLGSPKRIVITNGVLKTIRAIDEELRLSSSAIQLDENIAWLNTIFEIRHFIIHNGGVVGSQANVEKMINKWACWKPGQEVEVEDNDIDAVLWFFRDTARAFVRALDARLLADART